MTDNTLCPRCENPYRVDQVTNTGGRIDHDEADQARTCFVLERVDGTVRCHLYYHARRDLLNEGDPDAPVDLTADHGGGV